MKMNFFNIIFLIATINIYSQNLTIDEIISLRKKDITEVEEFLNTKKWSLLNANQPDNEKLGLMAFSFGKNEFDDKAQAFLGYYFSENSELKRIDFDFFDKIIYNNYLTRIKSLGCKLIDSKVNDGEITKTYQGSTTTIKITIGTKKNDFNSTYTFYNFFIVSNEDYNTNYNTELTKEEFYVNDDKNSEITIGEGREMSEYEIAEANYLINSKNNTVINKKYFIGKWIDEYSNFTFFENGDLIINYNYGDKTKTKWKFINNELLIDLNGNNNFIKYNIINNDSKSFDYTIEENSTIYKAYKIK